MTSLSYLISFTDLRPVYFANIGYDTKSDYLEFYLPLGLLSEKLNIGALV
jgi:hypothetical protein